MNITDVDLKDYEPTSSNLFEDIYNRQLELMQALYKNGKLRALPTDKMNEEMVKDSLRRALEEIFEAELLLKNKEWKKTQMLTDVDHFREELADALHFYVEALHYWPVKYDLDISKIIDDYAEADLHDRSDQHEIKEFVFDLAAVITYVANSKNPRLLKDGLELLLGLCKRAGMDEKMIHETYIKKWHVNLWRIETDY